MKLVLVGLVLAAVGCDAFAPGSFLSGAGPRGSVRPAASRALQGRVPAMQLRPQEGGARSEAARLPSGLARAAPLVLAAGVLAPAAVFAAPPEWLEPTRSSLDIFLALFSTLFFIRIPISWYPQMDLTKFPQAIVCWPTEPFLKVVRGVTPPLFGVDISPIVIYGVLSFIREIFLGQQGLLIMMAQK